MKILAPVGWTSNLQIHMNHMKQWKYFQTKNQARDFFEGAWGAWFFRGRVRRVFFSKAREARVFFKGAWGACFSRGRVRRVFLSRAREARVFLVGAWGACFFRGRVRRVFFSKAREARVFIKGAWGACFSRGRVRRKIRLFPEPVGYETKTSFPFKADTKAAFWKSLIWGTSKTLQLSMAAFSRSIVAQNNLVGRWDVHSIDSNLKEE